MVSESAANKGGGYRGGCALCRLTAAAAAPTAAALCSLSGVVQPFWISQAQAIVFYSFTKNAALVGKAKGHGFIVAR